MKSTELLEYIQTHFPFVSATDETYGIPAVTIPPEKLTELIIFLKQDEKLKFDFLTDLAGIHFPDRENEKLGMVYLLHSFTKNSRIRIRCFLPTNNPSIPSLAEIFSAANWMERETYDFFGIRFTGHPDLRRIMNEDSMDYFPMLKQYHLEDATRTDKVDSFFGREGNYQQTFESRPGKQLINE